MKSKKLNTKFQNLNSNHGITLIALIITIVVMLILVVVTLSIALGENGIVGNAKKAARDTNSAMANDANIADDVTYGDVQGIDNIIEELTRQKVSAKDLEIGDTVTVVLKNGGNPDFSSADIYRSYVKFDNNTCIAVLVPNELIDKTYAQITYGDYEEPIISEENPAYCFFAAGTTVIEKRITETKWYKSINGVTMENAESLPIYELSVITDMTLNDASCEVLDQVFDFYK